MLEGSEGGQQPPDLLEEITYMNVKDYYRTHVVQTDGSLEHIERPSVCADVGVELDSPFRHFNLSPKVRY